MPAKLKNIEFLIVGQGLVGTNLAFRLFEMGRSFCIFDPSLKQAASVVSAGLLNPVTGPRLHLSWQADEHLRTASAFYRRHEEVLNCEFFQQRSIIRVLRSQAERDRWRQRRDDPAYEGFLSPLLDDVADLPANAPGFCRILRAGSIEPAAYLHTARAWFLERGMLHEEKLDPNSLQPDSSGVDLPGGRVKNVIFCEGWTGLQNPWFSFLPLEPASGEIIRLRSNETIPSEVVNSGKWILPLDGEVRVGSTFLPGVCPAECTPGAAKELARKAKEILGWKHDGEVVGHEAGVRPCSRDKLPFLGRHPEFPCLAVANGFGAKGALTSPLCTLRLARHLVHGEELHPHEDVARWQHLR